MIHRLRGVDPNLPSKFGQVCLVLVAVGGCAGDPEVTCETKLLRVERVRMPTTNTQAREAALDLDGDGDGDNIGGLVASTILAQIPQLDLTASANARLADDVVWELEVSQCSDGSTHVDGQMPVSTLWDPTATFDAPGWLSPRSAKIDVKPTADGRWEGRVAMAFAPRELIDAVVAPMAPYFDEHQLFMEHFDVAPRDGHITVDEMRDAEVVRVLFAPDLEGGGTSFAIEVTASERPAS